MPRRARAFAAVAVASAATGVAWLAGRSVGRLAGGVVLEPGAATMLIAPSALGAAAAGAAAVLAAPHVDALDPQLRAAPISRRRLVLAAVVVPLVAAAALVAPVVVVASVALARELPGGWSAGLALAATLAAAAACGAALAEAAVGSRRHPLAALTAAAGIGAALVPLDPLGAAAAALVGSRGAGEATARAAAAAAPAAAAWLLLVARRPDAPARGRRRAAVSVPSAPALAWLVTALVRATRPAEARRAACAALVFGYLGVVGGAALAVALSGALLLGATTTLLVASIVPLAQPARETEARWVWLVAHRSPGAAPAAAGFAALAVAVALVAAVAVPGVVVGPATEDALRPLAVATAALAGLALAVGSLLRWRGDRAADQLASLAALAAAALALSLLVGAVSEPALRVLPEPAFAALVAVAPLAAGAALLHHTFRRVG
ncbi:MAG TPA: hypothetical protein VNT58_10680 [Gaiellaceae bacterium]|nr:hypothetical protein [Gaiellaceae bacterium]